MSFWDEYAEENTRRKVINHKSTPCISMILINLQNLVQYIVDPHLLMGIYIDQVVAKATALVKFHNDDYYIGV